MSVVRDKHGELKYYLEIIEDIQEKKIAENRMNVMVAKLRDINNSLENFTHIVSYDLKELLSNINAILNWFTDTNLDKQQLSYHQMLDDRVKKNIEFVNVIFMIVIE